MSINDIGDDDTSGQTVEDETGGTGKEVLIKPSEAASTAESAATVQAAAPSDAVPDSGDLATTERAKTILNKSEKLKGRKIVIVDDEESIRTIIPVFMEGAGAEVLGVYESAEKFLADISNFPPNASIVLDNTMGKSGMSGLFCAKHLRETGMADLKILIQSGDADPSIFTPALESGIINGFLQKPWDKNELIGKIASL